MTRANEELYAGVNDIKILYNKNYDTFRIVEKENI